MLLHAILGLSPAALAVLIGICILGGSAKGALGIGIPLLAVPLTAPFMDLPAVMALLTVPIFATNLGQAIEGAGTRAALLRLWPTLLAVVAGTVTGVHLLVSIDRTMLNGAVGVLLVLVAAWLFWQPRIVLRMPNKTGNEGASGLLWAAWPSLSCPMSCGT
ncbi:MAG: sulfite exporter TauE/SafE family protein [Alphaproteobacteria bacterium]